MTGTAPRTVPGSSPPPGPARVKPKPILELKNVAISYMVRAGELKVVPNVSLTLHEGEALGLVGESMKASFTKVNTTIQAAIAQG